MIQTYRVEHRVTKGGPFYRDKPDLFLRYLITWANYQRRLKSPTEDKLHIHHLPCVYVFGAPSIPKLKEWIFFGRRYDDNRRIVKALKKRNFTIAEYLVADEDYVSGRSGNQLLFCPDTSREEGLVQYHDLDILFKESPFVFDVN